MVKLNKVQRSDLVATRFSTNRDFASGSGAERNPHAPGIFLYQAMVDAIADNVSTGPELE